MTRTPDEIRASVYAACNGDWADDNQRIADLQRNLCAALIWVECAPAEGWHAIGHRQMDALREMLQNNVRENTLVDVFSLKETPEQVLRSVAQHLTDNISWDIDVVDAYIRTAEGDEE